MTTTTTTTTKCNHQSVTNIRVHSVILLTYFIMAITLIVKGNFGLSPNTFGHSSAGQGNKQTLMSEYRVQLCACCTYTSKLGLSNFMMDLYCAP